MSGFRNKLRKILKLISLPFSTKGGQLATSMSVTKGTYRWLSLEDFEHEVLSKTYRGIFIQEPIIDWNYSFHQRPQHICRELGAMGYLVIYRSPLLGDDPDLGFTEVEQNVWITKSRQITTLPNAVHCFYSGVNHMRNIVRLKKLGIKILYDYVDKIDPKICGRSLIFNHTLKLDRQKQFCIKHADWVICTASELKNDVLLNGRRDRVHLVRNGVKTSHFTLPLTSASLPDAFKLFCERYDIIVGYFGAIAPWLWFDEINHLITTRTDIGFVFLGGEFNLGSKKITNEKNVFIGGHIPYRDLPIFATHFDVCWIPFEPGEIAKTTSPLKLYEYFALGKPVVVSSEMKECTQYPEVFFGSNRHELSSAIDQAFSKSKDENFRQEMYRLALANDWQDRAKQLAEIIETRR